MTKLKIKAVWLLTVTAGCASALSGYQVWRPAAKTTPAIGTRVLETAPASRSKSGTLAFIDSALRRELESLAPDATTGVFVHFTDAALPERAALLSRHGLTAVNDFQPWADSVYATGTASAFFAIAADVGVYYLEQNEKLSYLNHTANWAIRTRFAQERVGDGPYYDAAGNVLTGKGIGVAVVDSGADGRHPDFQRALKRNYKVLAAGNPIDVGLNASSDTSGGHGIHVAGTIMADGSASLINYPDAAGTPYIKGSFAGVAPDVSLYAYGCGEAISVAFATQAFQHILDNYDNRTIFPERIRAINNSYGNGAGSAYAPNGTQSQLTRALVAKGVSVVFAAGNSGDATDADTTSSTCKDPTPGVICVASYSDLGTGSRDGVMSTFTSQGPFANPLNYPDVAAPGQDITSTCTAALPICKSTEAVETAFLPFYGTISGTSMATPHTVGSIALILQARPDLTADAVEKLLQNTARKIVDNVYDAEHGAYRADPQNADATVNYRIGAGLIDVPRALDVLGVRKFGSLPAAGEYTVIGGDGNVEGGADDGSLTATGASDFVSLKLIEETKGGVAGIGYRLTVADAADLGDASFVTYQVISNIDGRRFTTAVTLTETGITADTVGASTSAPATSVSRTGNLISFFVPLGALGTPPVGAPMHNVQVIVSSDASGVTAEADYAPSGDPMLGTSATEPGFGKPYTILTLGTPVVENRCAVPGLTLLSDAGGDAMTTSTQDLLSASVAQPLAANGNPNLVFTIKVASLASLTPGSGYFLSFQKPDASFGGVRMEVTNPNAPAFFTYTPSGGQNGAVDGRFVGTQVAAAAGSGYDAATGVITIVATPQSLGLTAPGQMLSGFNGGVTQTSDPAGVGAGATLVTDEMPDGLGRVGAFEFKANAFCAGNALPIAVLKADKLSGSKPLAVSFSGIDSRDDDAGDSVASYTFTPGDGGAVVTQSTPAFAYTYGRSGTFVASLSVKDSRGGESAALSQLTLGIVNDAPVAVLAADQTSGQAPLAVAFDATASTDPNMGDVAALYSFDLDGDGSFEIVDSDSAKPSFTYQSAGSFDAQLKVRDSEGLESAAVTRTITVTTPSSVNTAPVARLVADKSSGPAPLTVRFDAVTSSDPDAGDAVASYSFDLDGDGLYELADVTTAAVSRTYDAAGSYAAKVKVKDRAGLESAAQALTITVTASSANNRAPTARLVASPATGTAPLVVQFDATSSSDADVGDAIVSYSFDLDGDGVYEIVDVAKATASLSYTRAGSFAAKVKVKDKAGLESTAATRTITVNEAAVVANNRAPIAVLAAVNQTGPSPLTVLLNGNRSFDPDAADSIARYRFDFGDGSPVIDSAAREVQHVYTQPGRHVASLVVTDSRGMMSEAKTLEMQVSPASAATDGGGGGGAFDPRLLFGFLMLLGLRRRH